MEWSGDAERSQVEGRTRRGKATLGGDVPGGCPAGPWASPIVLVKKKDGMLQFCADYEHLNSSSARCLSFAPDRRFLSCVGVFSPGWSSGADTGWCRLWRKIRKRLHQPMELHNVPK